MRLAFMLAWMTLTRVPVTPGGRLSREPNAVDLARATVFYPLIGGFVGASSVGLGHLASWLHDSAHWQAALTLLASLVLTGAMHHDGLADTCDALSAGSDRERALSIMRDSRIGTFGSLALIVAIGLEWQALVSLIEDGNVWVPYTCAHMFGRLCAALVLALAQPARTHDQSLAASSIRACTLRYAWAASVLWAILSWWAGLTSLILLLATAWTGAALGSWAARRRWGGITGDVVGATVVIATLLHVWLVGCKN